MTTNPEHGASAASRTFPFTPIQIVYSVSGGSSLVVTLFRNLFDIASNKVNPVSLRVEVFIVNGPLIVSSLQYLRPVSFGLAFTTGCTGRRLGSHLSRPIHNVSDVLVVAFAYCYFVSIFA